MPKFRLALLIAFVPCFNLGSEPSERTPSNAHELLAGLDAIHMKSDLAGEEKLLQSVIDSNPTDEERSTAERRLAWLAFRFHKDFPGAELRLARAEAIHSGLPETLLMRATMEMARNRFADARAAAERALAISYKRHERGAAILAFTSAAIEEVFSSELDGTVEGRRLDPQVLHRALGLIESEVVAEPGRFTPSREMLQVALCLRDGPKALTAWRSYFWVPQNAPAPGILAAPGRTLQSLLQGWKGSALTPDERVKLIDALAASRLYPEAALVALDPKASAPAPEQARDILAHARFCRRVAKAAEEHYRLTAIGTPSPKSIKEMAVEAAGPLWKSLTWNGPAPVLDWSTLYTELAARFGAEIAGPSWGLGLGHRILDETRQIEQYGKKGEIRFIVLDGMFSRGYINWLTDGKASVGAYTGGQHPITIIQFRGDDALRVWTEVTDPVTREKADEITARATADDEILARKEPVAYFKGLNSRMWRDACRGVLSSLQAKGFKGDDLRFRFLIEFQNHLDASGFAHEERHAIDIAMGIQDSEELEFRARLSQMALPPAPLLGAGTIFAPNIGNPNDVHGRANRRIMEGLLAWMITNRGRIEGLDASKPLLPQFDKLTPEQMKAAFQSMDPLVNKAVTDNKP